MGSSAPSDTPPTGKGFRDHIAPGVFYPAAAVILAFVIFGAAFTGAAGNAFDAIQSAIVAGLGWYYILIVAGFIVFSLVIGFSRYGTIRLGPPDSRPDFSRVTWFTMLFSAGMGIGLVFWGVAEPLAHFESPPRGGQPETIASAQEAVHITYVHWGIHAWAIYVAVGLALAYAVHRRGRPLSIRWALEPLLGERVRGRLGDIIDITAVVGTLFGVATSLGLGALQINAGLDFLGVAGSSTAVQIVLIAIITAVATVSVVSGLRRGIKWLSQVNMVLAGVLLVFVLLAGPTIFIIEEFIGSLGYYLQNVLRTTFEADAFYGNEFQAAWTTFYWGWWISWAPFVGVFIARISRGRTIREFIIGVLLVPTILTFFWFSVMGGTALNRQLFGEGGLLGLSSEQALFRLLDGLPLTTLMVVIAVVLVTTFFVTSSDSASLVVDMLASGGDLNPPAVTRVFWAVMEGVVAMVLLITGGLAALQTAAIATALPFSIVMVLMCLATIRVLRSDHQALAAAGLVRQRGGGREQAAPADQAATSELPDSAR